MQGWDVGGGKWMSNANRFTKNIEFIILSMDKLFWINDNDADGFGGGDGDDYDNDSW